MNDRTTSTQRAGDGATQQQLIVQNMHVGMTASEVRDIALGVMAVELQHWGSVGEQKGAERIEAFIDHLTPKLELLDKLDFLNEPDNLLAFRKAATSAAASGDKDNYETLAELLTTRSQNGERMVKSAIDRALSIVHDIDDTALDAISITAAFIFGLYRPPYFESFAERFRSVNTGELPQGTAWVDHCEQLGLLARDRLSEPTLLSQALGRLPGASAPVLNLVEVERIYEAIHLETGLTGPWFSPHPVFEGVYASVYSPSHPDAFDWADLDTTVETMAQVKKHLSAAIMPTTEETLQVKLQTLLTEDTRTVAFDSWWNAKPAFHLTPSGIALGLVAAQKQFAVIPLTQALGIAS